MTWHTLEHSTFSPELEAESLQTFCLDTYLSELAKLNPIPETSCSPGNETDSCQSSPSGTTYAPLMESPGEDQLMFFVGDSPVKTSVRRVKEQELPGAARDYGRNMRDSLGRCGLSLSLPKTVHCFALGDLELSSKIWPRWGIMLDGECSELGMSARHINETECGSWPTPDVRGFTNDGSLQKLSKSGVSRTEYSQMAYRASKSKKEKIWPTPTAHNAKEAGYPAEFTRNTVTLTARAHGGDKIPQTYPTPTASDNRDRGCMEDESIKRRIKVGKQIGLSMFVKKNKTRGSLNPLWVEWLMGWPIGWTDLKPLETDKFRNVQQWHSVFSRKD